MSPISITFTKERLRAVCRTMEIVDYIPTHDKCIRSDRAIFSETRTKLFRKLVERELNTKDFKLKLKYYEAHQLEQWLREWLFGQSSSIDTTLVRLVADELDQKLT